MNPNLHRPAWGVALAALVLTLTAACGSDVPSAPGDIGDPVDRLGEPADPKSGLPDQRRGPSEQPIAPPTPAPPVYLGV
ncbi:MAG: hypothetical protein ACRDOM_06755 [Nocardioides sp.]